MCSLRPGRAAVLLAVAVTFASAGCGRSTPEPVSAGAPAPTTAAGAGSTTVASGAGSPTSVAAPTAGPTTTTLIGAEGAPDPSPVARLSAVDLRRLVAGAAAPTTRSVSGPTVQQVAASGRTYWRIRIPGSVPARSARIEVLVGGRVVGQGFETPALDALVAVTADGSGLVAGAPVTYRWGDSAPVAAGALAVVR